MVTRTIGMNARIMLVGGTLIGLAAASGCAADELPVRIAVVDSGIAADLDVFGDYTIVADADTVAGTHGTMMASVALGMNADGVDPVDPARVQLLSIDVDAGGKGTDTDLAEGIVTAVDEGASVILVSRGVRRDSARLRSAVVRAHEAGAVIVAAAGNVRFLPADFPARYPDVISVGAATSDGQPWDMSATEHVDGFALGVDVPVVDEQGTTRVESGTSVAAAMVVHDLLQQLVGGTITDPGQYQISEVIEPAM